LHKISDAPSIVVEDVHKEFRLRHTHSIKESVVAAVRGKTLSTRFRALDGVSFEIAPGEAVALLGFNGSGKSTMLKMISGVLRPDAGRVATRGRVAGLIEVGAGFHPDLSGRENIYLNAAILGMSKKETDERFDEIVAFSEIEQFIDTEVKHYSSGMFLRLAFSVAIHTEVDILLIDEILSVGDEPFQKKCLARIRELHAQGRTLVVVSHDLDMIARLCDRGIILRGGRVEFDGGSDAAVTRLREIGWSPFIDLSHDHPSFDAVVELFDAGALAAEAREGTDQLEFRPNAAASWDETRTALVAVSPSSVSVEEQATVLKAVRSAGDRDDASGPTRAQVAELLHRLAGSPLGTATDMRAFSDVTPSSPHAGAIAWLGMTGIARGWDEGRKLPGYRPNEHITREALAVMLSRFRALDRHGSAGAGEIRAE